MAKAQTAQARVRRTHAGIGIKCGQIVTGPEPVIKSLAAAGVVDANPDAVAYAVKSGAEQVALPNPDAAAEIAAAATESKQAEGSTAVPAAPAAQ